MADEDMNWPTEDEDFDATMAKATKVTAKPKKTQVTVSDAEEKADEPAPEATVQEADPEPDTEPETPVAAAVAEPETAEAPVEAEEPEPSTDPEPEAAPEREPEPESSVSEEPPQAAAPVAKPKRSLPWRLILEIILVIAVLVLGLWAWTLYSDRNSLQDQVAKLNENPQVAVQKQANELISRVDSLIDLPKDETPTIANVSDANQARKQSAFFTNAQNGDKVLMYVKAGQAILYRPSTNKIILVAPLTFTNNQATPSSKTSR
jgi:hypothetical protein